MKPKLRESPLSLSGGFVRALEDRPTRIFSTSGPVFKKGGKRAAACKTNRPAREETKWGNGEKKKFRQPLYKKKKKGHGERVGV